MPTMTLADKYAAMPDAELAELVEMLDEDEGCYVACPHCDGTFPHGTGYCWCAGCDACDRARLAVAETAAAYAEYERRHPTPPAPAATATTGEEPF